MSGCSVVRPAHVPWEHEIRGSNPLIPTKLKDKFMIWLIAAFMVLGASGALTDAFMWGKRRFDKNYWLKRSIDIFWLIGMACVVPALFFMAGRVLNQMELWRVFLLFLGIGCGASILWDMLYFLVRKDRWPAACWYWLWLPDVLRIGFTKREFIVFTIIRLAIVVLTVRWGLQF